ncbi:hypothetical protein [Candidatus Flexifilum breve]
MRSKSASSTRVPICAAKCKPVIAGRPGQHADLLAAEQAIQS